jgi:transcriptional regulator with XRE-family HTH domain
MKRKKAAQTITAALYAKCLGVSKQMVSKYVKAGMPTLPDGSIDPAAATAWRNANISRHDDETLTDARKRDLGLTADLKEQELRRRRGELLEKAEVEKQWSDLLLNFRKAMLQLPGRLAPRVVNLKDLAAIHALLDKEVRQVLTTLSGYDPEDGK